MFFHQSMSGSKLQLHKEETCHLCLSANADENRFGPKYKLGNLVVHYFCLLFACGLVEKGSQDDGILGFMKKDIIKEIERAELLKCVFCGKKGAASGCCVRECKLTYHFICGLDNDILFQFKSPDYPSFCSEHRPIQDFTRFIRDEYECPLCSRYVQLHVDPRGLTFIKAPCCNSLIHRNCLQKYASTKTIDTFNCPACEDRQRKFLPEMQDFGIYIPEKVGTKKSQDIVLKSEECDLCGTAIHDVLRLGPKFQIDELNMHRFCYYFAYDLSHKGKRKSGHSKKDIEDAIDGAKEQECVFCKEFAASNCCVPKCTVSYHYPCGLENGVLSQFKSHRYNTYCFEHRPRQMDTENLLKQDVRCSICFRKLEVGPFCVKFLKAPCCKCIFHRLCLQKRASIKDKSTFRCLCKDRKLFIPEMLEFGLFIPETETHIELRDEGQSTSTLSKRYANQKQDNSSSDDLSSSTEMDINCDTDMRRSSSQKSARGSDSTIHSSFNIDISSDSEMSNVSVSIEESTDSEHFSKRAASQNTSLSPINVDQVVNPSYYIRKTIIEMIDDVPNTAQSDEESPVGSSKIDRDKLKAVKIENIAGPSCSSTQNKRSASCIPLKTEEDEGIKFLRKVENSREEPYKIAIKRARKMLPNAFVQPNGRVHTKICKVCGYFTYAEGPSSYDHERSHHRSLMDTSGDLFEEEELRENVAVLIMARQIL